jgi:hypothetical protein
MTNTNDLDRKIQQALSDEDAELFGEVGEMAMFEMMFDSFKGRLRRWMCFVFVFLFVFAALMFYCLWRFVTAQSADDRVFWGVFFIMTGLAQAMMKMWWWMQMDKRSVLREIKRVELQIATLAGRLRG